MLASAAAPSVAPRPAAQPPAATPAAPAAGPSFSQLLSVQAAAPVQPEATPDAEPAQPAPASTPRRTAQAAKPAAPAAQPRPAQATALEAKAATERTDPDTETIAATADDDAAADTPELKEFTQLLGMSATPTEPPRPDLQRGRPTAAAADDAPQSRPGPRGVATDTGRAMTEPVDARHARATDLRADAAKADARADVQSLRADAAAAPPSGEPATAAMTPATPSFAATLAQALPGAPAQQVSVPTEAGVRAPVRSDAFAPELGARVSLLAVDGVQQAQLQLNPADMGPVSVQITVDGNQAQVSFHAVQAETRQALEQSLPDLAAALQGQGLTLSGGGVFQQAARDTNHEADPADDRGSARGPGSGADRIAAAATPAQPASRRSVGLLDTFA